LVAAGDEEDPVELPPEVALVPEPEAEVILAVPVGVAEGADVDEGQVAFP